MAGASEVQGVDQLREIAADPPEGGPPLFHWVRKAPRGIKRPGEILGVFASSFNPPTRAHHMLVQKACGAVAFDEVLLILDRKAMDKEIFGAPLEERLWMVLLCIEKDPQFSVAFTNRGLFLDKLELVEQAYPEGTRVYFIVGYDTLARILDPKYYPDRDVALRKFFGGAQLLVANRGTMGVEEIKELMNREENRPFSEKIRPLKIPFSTGQLSSTQIRKRIRSGRGIGHLVPKGILSYIEKRGLYRS